MSRPRVALALGSGGLRGMAHIGVLRALEEAEIRPTIYAGSSAGALVAAAAAHGFALADLESVADRLQRSSVFQIDYLSLLRYGLRTPALYRSERLLAVCHELFGDTTFRGLKTPLILSTVEVETTSPLWWGLSSLPDASIADAVYASCAMPGLLPPGRVGGRLCMDGGVLDPLALGGLAPLADLVIAVVLDRGASLPPSPTPLRPAPSLWWHAQSIVMRDLSRHTIEEWDGPPLLLIRPDLQQAHSLRGGNSRQMIQAGYEAARETLSRWEGEVRDPGFKV
ncbi:MAG: patatin-like phospholipase family protein [Gemmatimonadales bacterium]